MLCRNPATLNMCSKCYRDTVAEQERSLTNEKAAAQALNVTSLPQQPVAQPLSLEQPNPQPSQPAVAVQSVPEPASAPGAPSTSAAAADDKPSRDDRPVQKNHSRCFSCKKKIGLTGFKCRCGYTFCGTHRYAEAHACDFDYKELGRQTLAKQNPLCMASKVQKL